MAVLLGRTSAGTTADFTASGGTAAWDFVASASGDLTTIFAQTKVANAGATGVRLGIYSNGAGVPATGGLLGVASATSFTGTGVFSATLGTPVAIVSGTTYWLAWFAASENFDFQGDSSGNYKEFGAADFPNTSWGGATTGSTNAIIWGESTGANPVVETTNETAVSTAGTSHVVNLPASIAAGDLLLLVLGKGSTAATINAHADWTELLDENAATGFYIAYRWATGSEGATTTLTSSANTRSATIAYRISGAENPATQPPEIGTTATGSSTTPDPPSVTPTGGAKDYLWLAALTRGGEEADDDTWVSAAPSGFTGLLQKACGTVGTNLAGMVATAQRAENAASKDPATFTIATGAWRAQTIAVHPPSGVVADIPYLAMAPPVPA